MHILYVATSHCYLVFVNQMNHNHGFPDLLDSGSYTRRSVASCSWCESREFKYVHTDAGYRRAIIYVLFAFSRFQLNMASTTFRFSQNRYQTSLFVCYKLTSFQSAQNDNVFGTSEDARVHADSSDFDFVRSLLTDKSPRAKYEIIPCSRVNPLVFVGVLETSSVCFYRRQ